MTDREKVMSWLEGLSDDDWRRYHSDSEVRTIAKAALKLLKEKEEDKPKGHWIPYEPDKRGYTDGFTCSRCERVILSDHYCKMIDFDFCPYCGAYMDNADGR